jgi:hypothetical protein
VKRRYAFRVDYAVRAFIDRMRAALDLDPLYPWSHGPLRKRTEAERFLPSFGALGPLPASPKRLANP